MAFRALFPPLLVTPSCKTVSVPASINSSIVFSRSFRCMENIDHDTKTANHSLYPPSFWDYDHVKSLTSDYSEEKCGRQVEKLKDEVKDLINAETEVPSAKLELIDSAQRLGLKYHFEKEIKRAVDVIHKYASSNSTDDLFTTALQFRLLRQHGYDAPQGVFDKFRDENGNFKAGLLEDVKGLLSLYEASFLGFEDENIIEEAKVFAELHLKNVVTTKGNYLSPEMERKVIHALDMPLHWRLPRLEARWFIDTYAKEHNMNPALLRLAKLDYNILQSVYQKEVNQVSSWWVDELGLNKLSIVIRDRLMESYFWSNGMVSGAEYGASRKITTKVATLLTCLDDIYDVHCSPEELQLVTDFVDRWDMSEIDKLPYNVRTFLLALFNTTNDMGYWTLKERGFNIIPYLSKQWANLCKSFLKEAMWSHGGYRPSLDEYLENAVISASGPLLLFSIYFGNADKEALTYIEKLPTIMRCSSMILRLTNDLATSAAEMERGEVNSIACYMKDTGATEEVAREYIDGLIHKTWKTMNKYIVMDKSYVSEPFLSAILNLARTSQCMYQHGDGHSVPDSSTKDYLNDLLVQPCLI